MEDNSNVISALWQSFYSVRAYRDIQQWRGRALAYLALILVLCWTPLMIRAQVLLVKALTIAEARVIPQIPEIRFAQGKISTPENRPYLFQYLAGGQKVAFIIDTSGRYKSLDGQEARILLTASQCFIRQKTGEVRTYDLSKNHGRPLVIDQPALHHIVQIIKRWAILVIAGFIVVLSLLKRLFQAFLIALAGLGLASALEVDLDVGELLSLAIVAMTPAMVVETVFALLGIHFPWQWLLWGLLIGGYFIFAVNSASTKTPPSE